MTRNHALKSKAGLRAAAAAAEVPEGLRFARRREAFVNAATEIMNLVGVRGMQLADVASKLGMTTPSVRYYFKKKEDLAAACLLRAIDRLSELVGEAVKEGAPQERLRRFVELYLDLLRRVRVGEEPPLANFSDVRTLAAQNVEPVATAYLDLFRGVRAIYRGEEFDWLDRDGRNARTHLLLSLVLWAPAWIGRYDAEDHERIALRMVDVLLRGFHAQAVATWDPPAIAAAGLVPQVATDPGETFLIAATKLINEQGYRGASVDRIAAELNLTKGAFYHRHDAKDDVVVECFQRSYDIIGKVQRAAMALPANGWGQLAAVCSALAEFQLSPAGPLLLNAAISALPTEVAGRAVVDWDRACARFALMISTGMIDGSIRPVDAAIAAQMVNAGVNSTAQLSSWVPGMNRQAVSSFYIRPMLTGILNR